MSIANQTAANQVAHMRNAGTHVKRGNQLAQHIACRVTDVTIPACRTRKCKMHRLCYHASRSRPLLHATPVMHKLHQRIEQALKLWCYHILRPVQQSAYTLATACMPRPRAPAAQSQLDATTAAQQGATAPSALCPAMSVPAKTACWAWRSGWVPPAAMSLAAQRCERHRPVRTCIMVRALVGSLCLHHVAWRL